MHNSLHMTSCVCSTLFLYLVLFEFSVWHENMEYMSQDYHDMLIV